MGEYSELAARAAEGTLRRVPGTQRDAAAATDAIDQLFIDASGADTAEQAYQLAAGRPALGGDQAPSQMWRLRVPAGLDRRMRDYADRTHRTMSEITREAVDGYLRQVGA